MKTFLQNGQQGQAIAIIGMAGQFPQAATIEQFWENLLAGRDCITTFSDAELAAAGVPQELLRHPRYVKAGGFVETAELFDAAFFDLSPREALYTDPQHRVFLECAWHALEHAGYDPSRYDGDIGVFAGSGINTYFRRNLLGSSEALRGMSALQVSIGNEKDYLSTRVSYKLNLTGPSMTVQTACSTSLVAVQLACMNLLAGLCNMALAGGVHIQAARNQGYLLEEGDIRSPEGRCRAFDASANGTVFSDGAAVVVLKPLEDALAQGDTVYAVIRAIAINNDGSRKIGFTAPGVHSQTGVIMRAQELADIHPETIGYIEAHGTGTLLGDPIELASLRKAFGARTEMKHFCALGSVKTNVGHLDAAAGVTGLIKAALALYHRKLPGLVNFTAPNACLELGDSPFYIQTELADWPAGAAPRRAGITSLGVGGTNVHAVLEEPPQQPEAPESQRPAQLLLLSAKTASALQSAADNLACCFERHPGIDFADAAYTLQVGRGFFRHRRFIVAAGPEEAASALRLHDKRFSGCSQEQERPVAFLFPDAAAWRHGLGSRLFRSEPAFRQAIGDCADALPTLFGDFDLIAWLYPAAHTPLPQDGAAEYARAHLGAFTTGYGLARLLMSWGVQPRMVGGIGVGELAAACIAGLVPLQSALSLCFLHGLELERSHYGARSGGGRDVCLSVGAAAADPDGAGEPASIAEDLLRRACMPLSGTQHGPTVLLPCVSGVTGAFIDEEDAGSPDFWMKCLQNDAASLAGLAACSSLRDCFQIIAGPSPVQDMLALLGTGASDDQEYVSFLAALGKLWLAGHHIDWSGLYCFEQRRRIALPGYPFERVRYWVEPDSPGQVPSAEPHSQMPAACREGFDGARLFDRPELAAAYAAPETESEKKITGIWQQVLGIGAIGRHDDFYDIGGDSIIAAQVIARIEHEFSCELPVRLIFENPTIAELSAKVQRHIQRQTVCRPVTALDRMTCTPPLSLSQERLWFIQQLEPQSPAFNITHAVRLTGQLDPALLEQALGYILKRHEVFRTTFRSAEGQPQLVIGQPPRTGLRLFDFTGMDPDAARESAAAGIRLEAVKPFNLEKGPLFRPLLYRITPQESLFILNMHHIIADGWSLGIWLQELGLIYADLKNGLEPKLAPLAVQYADFAAWQRDWMNRQDFSEHAAYWRRMFPLEEKLPVLHLPADFTRPPELTHAGAHEPLRLDAGLTGALNALSKEKNCTLFATLMAAYMALLYRYSNQQTIIIGLPHANRKAMEVESLVGFFLNMLPLRGDLAGDMTFAELLEQVRQRSQEAIARHEYPFEQLVEELKPERTLNLNPIFQVIFAFQNFPLETRDAGGLRISPIIVGRGATEHDLALYLWEEQGVLRGAFEYSTELFAAKTMQRLAQHFLQLVAAVSKDPELRLSEIPLLTPGEVLSLEQEWRASGLSLPDCCLHRLFEDQAGRTPDACALVHGSLHMTYGELNSRANRLARVLQQQGIGPDCRVGVFFERSAGMVIAVLAALKAGCAYVPIDPGLPAERISFMLEDGGMNVLLTQPGIADRIPKGCTTRIVPYACRQEDAPQPGDSENPESQVRPENLAYVIYTSGSTGTPKGVLIEHRSVVNLLLSMGHELDVQPCETVLAITTLSFDIAGLDLFLPLITGSRVIIADREDAQDAFRLAELLRQTRPTMLQATPTTWKMLLETGWTGGKGLLALSGGEALSRELADRLLATGADLWNGYGPTETTIYSTLEHVMPGLEQPGIGRALANTRLYILDEHGVLAPEGVAGELYIGGAGLARGYLGREDLTAERFLKDPFDQRPGSRMYRTGDLVRRRSDGTLEYLGRIDHQIKLRGYRIEPGEIEAVLRKYSGVTEAVVVAREESPDNTVLAAYITVQDREMFVTPELREWVRRSLPDYMAPTFFVLLEHFPLTPNGKIDRKALPEPDREASLSPIDYVPPRHELDRTLVEIWQNLLNLQSVSITGNYFDLGGNSLMATRLIAQIEKATGRQIPLAVLFRSPTIMQLADLLGSRAEQHSRKQPRTEKIAIDENPILPIDRGSPIPLSLAQQRLWFMHQLEPDSPAFTIVPAIMIQGSLDVEAFGRALDLLVRRHEVFRSSFSAREGSPVVIIAAPEKATFQFIDLSAEHDGEALAREHIRRAALESFDFEKGPLYRMLLLRIAAAEHMFVCMVHHIIFDGWSIGLLLRDVMELYAACAERRPARLPELAVQYSDYALWHRQRLAERDFGPELRYWRGLLSGQSPVLQLPLDFPRPAGLGTAGVNISFSVPEAVTRSLAQLAQDRGATLFMVLVAGLATLLYRYTSQEVIVLGTPFAERTRTELDDIIGLFLNMLPLRADFKPDMTFNDVLALMRERSLEAYAHHELPFERLVEELQPERSLNHHPLFQVMLAYQNFPLAAGDAAGVSFKPLVLDRGLTEFDIAVYLWEETGVLQGTFEYSTDLFKTETIAAMIEQFVALLSSAAQNPNQTVREIPLLTESQLQSFAGQWAASDIPYPREATTAELFSWQAGRAPDRIAARHAGESITYGELDRKANRLAHRLRKLGIGPEALAGVFLERSLDMLAVVLAVHKAGAAYVPLDPAFPAERLEFMMQDCGMQVLITQDSLTGRVPEACSARMLVYDLEEASLALEPTGPIDQPAARGGNRAYVIYTSGSTGRPKGVEIEQSALVNFLLSMQREPGLQEHDVLLSVTTLSFDIAGLELFLPLVTGATVVIASRETAMDGFQLAREIAASGTTFMQATPATWSLLLEAGWQAGAGLKVLCGGEALTRDLADRLLATGCELWNMYGPTETTIWSSLERVQPGPAAPGLGQPVANNRLYILDEQRNLCPAGIAGELFIGGDGLARGYLGRGELTSERFAPDPFAGRPGRRMYRTGDLARRKADGTIEYLGRTDFQVKLRGYRIELGEIEAALRKHESVGEAVVAAREDRAGNKALAAYITVRDDRLPEPGRLRDFLRDSLPEYMVPSSVMVLDSLPLTPNGKVDRGALPAPEAAAPRSVDFTAPEDELELQLAGIWQSILGLQSISVTDNYFDIGGNSLLAVRLFAHMEKITGRQLPLSMLFRAPTVRQLAGILRQQDWMPSWSSLVPIRPGGSRPPLFLVHGAGGNVLLYHDLAGRLPADQPVYGLQASGLNGQEPCRTRVEEMAEAYIQDVLKLQPEGPYFLGGYCMGGLIAYEMGRLLERQGRRVALIALLDTYNSNDEKNSPMQGITHQYERVLFHIRNLLIITAEERKKFLREKFQELQRRIATAARIITSQLRHGLNKEVSPLVQLVQINDQAALQFQPQPCSNTITLFAPLKNYTDLSDPRYGWGKVKTGGLEIVQLNVYPAGMLMDPFVAELAAKLQQALAIASIAPAVEQPADTEAAYLPQREIRAYPQGRTGIPVSSSDMRAE